MSVVYNGNIEGCIFQGMKLVLTSYRYREEELLEELADMGDFHGTEFRDVIRGDVEDLEGFLQDIQGRTLFALSRVMPIQREFHISPDKAAEAFKEGVEPLIDEIKEGESFSVHVERRGFSDQLSSIELASEVGSFISSKLEERDGARPEVDLEDPDKAVIFEMISSWCGVGIISREQREKYFYLKLP